jgi:EmrB/QacA subfamily drug resistance transporter
MASSAARQVAAIGLGTAVAPLDTAVNIAFPAITRAFDLAIGDIQWVVICYVLTYVSLMLAFGRIGDMLGHAAIFRVGLAWSAVAYLLCALAPSFPALLVCRVLQGIGAALVLSCGVALATSLYAEDRRPRVLGAYATMFAVGATLGPFLGGALVQAWDWPAVFWFRAPVAAVALALLYDLPPRSRPAALERFDLPGAFLLVLTLVAMLLALSRVREPAVALPLALLALAAFAGFVRQEMRVEKPILDLGVFALPGFAALNLANALTNLGGFAVWLLVPFYLARATDLSVLASGAVLAVASLGAIVASPIAGRLIGRIAPELLALAGAAMVGAGLALVAASGREAGLVLLVPALFVQGLGLGLFQVAYTDIVTGSMPLRSRGVAGSLSLATRTIGNVGAAGLVMALFQALEPEQDFFAAFRLTFAFAALLPFAMAALLALRSR